MTDLVYPAGCRPLTEDLGTDELIRRLKTLANYLQAMGQDDGLNQKYVPLSLYLAEESFLQHPSRDVQLLIACCIADVLRVYAPEAPYKDQEQIKSIFLFFIKQLYGLKDPKDPSFKRYFYLLENLAYVKSFNMCFELEDSAEIFCQLFGMMFKIVNEEHSTKVKNFMIDIMSPLINEADNFTTDILDLILINVVEPKKTQNKYAYQLAEQLIIKTADSLETIIKMFFNQALVLDKVDTKFEICHKIYDLIYELHVICPNVLCSVLPQLECKLKSSSEQERLRAVALLARMFSERGSQISKKYSSLLRMFLGRFCDIAVLIRVKCVQSSMHFLLNQAHLRDEIIGCLRARQHDSEESVRYEVVMAIVETAKREFAIVCESEELLDIVRERTLDKKFKIRKEAMWGLAFVYKKAVCEPNDLSVEVVKNIEWIKNKIMHGYYMPTLEDRLQVERLLITSLVPYKLPTVERMKQLYHLMGSFDDNAMKAFVELQKNQMKTRKTVLDWVKLHKAKDMTPSMQSQLNIKQTLICKLLADPMKASEFLGKFSTNMRKDPALLRYMEIILKRDVSCKECADTMSLLLKKLGTPIMTNLYYQTVKMLIERIASVMVDKDSVAVLVSLIEDCLSGGETIKEIGLPESEAGEQGLKLLTALSYLFSPHFFTEKTLRHMISLLSYDQEFVAPLILKSLTHLGRYKPLISIDSSIMEVLAPVCKDFACEGTPKQAKHAVRCIFVNTQVEMNGGIDHADAPKTIHPAFNDIMDNLRSTLKPNCPRQRTKVVTLGHIAYNMPKAFSDRVKNMVARRIVKELLIQPVPEDRVCTRIEGEWCDQKELPADTLCKLDGLKTMARWLLGLRDDETSAKKTFRMLIAFIHHGGDLLNNKRMFPAESSWLRLSAGCGMLKICEQKGVGDQYTAEQYYSLSQLMFDPVPQVRDMFARKLHKGLNKGLPSNCLPLDFMGFYALAGNETDKKLLELKRQFLESDINRRREYLKTIQATNPETTAEQRLHILPDFILAFAIPILVHDPKFSNYQDRVQLKHVEKCLRFIIEPLMSKAESFSYKWSKNCTRILFIADPQLLGMTFDKSFYSALARYDSDRYLHSTFSQALKFTQPHVICFLGDLLDEGNVASPEEFTSYVERFRHIYKTEGDVRLIHIPGDNDIGGENGEYISNLNIQRFEEAFTQRDIFDYNYLRFFKINRMMLDFTNPDKVNNRQKLRVGLSHAPILIGGGPLLRSVLRELDPHVIFSGHWHESRIFLYPSTKVINFYDTAIKYFNLKQLKEQQHTYLEIMVPTSSYRMGKVNIGMGYAVLENDDLYYTVLWLPNRFLYLFLYAFWLLFAFCIHCVFRMMNRCPFRKFYKSQQYQPLHKATA